jgi:outer membrane protein, heavy metal efflux system
MMMSRQCWFLLGLVLLQGCYHTEPDHTDLLLSHLSEQVRDQEPIATPRSVTETPGTSSPLEGKKDEILPKPRTTMPMDQTPPGEGPNSLPIPADIPGSQLPVEFPTSTDDRDVKKVYPDLPPLPRSPMPAPGPGGKPMTLADLQSLAVSESPFIRSAAAAVDAARGGMLQAGAYPNPTVAWEADTVHTGGAGYPGAYFDQPIKGWNKLKLQTAVAAMELHAAEIALARAQYDLATQVRTSYFAVLVALENIKVSVAMSKFTDAIYRAQITLYKAGIGAPYEPMQLRPLVIQARLNLIQGINQYHAAWKQLAAAVGKPDLHPIELSGRVDWPIPVFHQEQVLAHILEHHTDVQSAHVSIQKARYSLELAEVTPLPDFDLRVLVQKDYSTPPNYTVYSAALSMPIPIWDQNRGGIIQAKNLLLQANQAPKQAQLQLITTLADAYQRYETSSQQVQLGRAQIEDQLRVYRAIYKRYHTQPDKIAFGDLVTAQQSLAGYVSAYITALGLQWQAVVDVGNLLQTNDLFQVCPTQEVMPVPDLEHLMRQVTNSTSEKVSLTTAFQSLFLPSDRRDYPMPAPPDAAQSLPAVLPPQDERNRQAPYPH